MNFQMPSSRNLIQVITPLKVMSIRSVSKGKPKVMRIRPWEGGVKGSSKNWRRACNKSSVDWHIRPKDRRHFFGSYLLNSGVDPLMIASFMGHASLDMLLKRYGHFTDESRREAILKFDQNENTLNASGYTNGTQTQ